MLGQRRRIGRTRSKSVIHRPAAALSCPALRFAPANVEARFLADGRTARSALGRRGVSEGTGHGPAREALFT